MRPLNLLCAVLIVSLSGCAGEPYPPCDVAAELNGTLVVSNGSGGLHVTKFPSGITSTVLHSEAFNYGRVLSAGPPGKLIGSSGNTISEIDLATGQMSVLRDGGMAVWEPQTDSLVYWHHPSQKSMNMELFVSGRDSDSPAERICGPPASIRLEDGADYFFLSPPVLLGDGKLAVLDEKRNVCVFDATTRTFEETRFDDCLPQAAREDGRRLFCTDVNSSKVFELDIQDSTKTELLGMTGTGFLYIEEINGLLLTTLEGHLFPVPHETVVSKIYHISDRTVCNLDFTVSWVQGEALWTGTQ